MEKMTPHELMLKTVKDLKARKQKHEIDVQEEISARFSRTNKVSQNGYRYRMGQR